MASQRPCSLYPSASFSPSSRALRWIGTFAVLAFLASLSTVSSCALGRSYCLSDTDCKPGYICHIAQCTLASSDASPNENNLPEERNDAQESDPNDTPPLEPDPNDTPPEPDPNDQPIPDGALCVDGATRPCDLSNNPNCTATARNHYDCQNTCYKGTQRCIGGIWPNLCETSNIIGAETCDGVNNDCDGQVDEGLKPCLTTLLRLTNPGTSRSVGLTIDPKTQALYTAVQNTNQTRFLLKKITLSPQETNLTIVPTPGTLPRNYEDVTAIALHTALSPALTLYFTEKKGCILYKAIVTNNIARVERLGDGICRPPAATLYTSPLPIQSARFIDIVSLAVHQPTGKLYIAEQTDQLLHVLDPTTNTIQTLHAAEKDDFPCKKSPSLSLLSLATDAPVAESVFLLHQSIAAEAGIFSFDFNAVGCTNNPLRVVPTTGLTTPTTFAPFFERNKQPPPFTSLRTTQPPTNAPCFEAFPPKHRSTLPVSVIEDNCSLQDGITTQGSTPAPQVGHIPAMAWDPSQKRLYFLDQSLNGSSHLRRLTP